MKPFNVDHIKIPPWMIPKKDKYREVQIPLYLPVRRPPLPEPGDYEVPSNEVNYEV